MNIQEKPKTIRVLNWDMDWCFTCDHPCARCPSCYVNDCAGGCRNGPGKCEAQDWWDSQKGHEWNVAREMYWRPSRDELVEYIKILENKDETLKFLYGGPPLKVISHARWHGVEVGFHMDCYDDWSIWLISVPDTEGREHILTQERAEEMIQLKKQQFDAL